MNIKNLSSTREMLHLFEPVKTIAIIGASTVLDSPGWRTAFGLHAMGVKVFFVSPGASDRLRIKTATNLSEISDDIDLVDCWGDRYNLEDWKNAFHEIKKKNVSVIWMEPNTGALAKEFDTLLSSATACVIRNKSLYAAYLSTYSCA